MNFSKGKRDKSEKKIFGKSVFGRKTHTHTHTTEKKRRGTALEESTVNQMINEKLRQAYGV